MIWAGVWTHEVTATDLTTLLIFVLGGFTQLGVLLFVVGRWTRTAEAGREQVTAELCLLKESLSTKASAEQMGMVLGEVAALRVWRHEQAQVDITRTLRVGELLEKYVRHDVLEPQMKEVIRRLTDIERFLREKGSGEAHDRRS